MDSAVVLDDGGDLAAILLQELSSPVSYGTVALNNESAIFDTLW